MSTGISTEANAIEQQMLLIAARKQELDRQVEAIQQGGFNTQVIDIDFYALERAYPLVAPQLPESHVQEYIAMINVDTNAMTLCVIHNKKMCYYRQQSYDGSALAPLILDQLGLQKVENEAYQKLTSTLNEQIIPQISRLLQFFHSEAGEKNVSLTHLLLSGRYAILPDIGKLIEEKVHTPVTIANPFCQASFSNHIDTSNIERQAPTYLLCCGLAMRGLG